jgi:2Fe-2S ferredoxin
MHTITFKFLQEGLEPIIVKDVKPDQSILEVALENDIDLHWDCGGVCACSTCQCYFEKGEQFFSKKEEREGDFISLAIEPKDNSRLSCQCILQKGDGEIEVTIPDQTKGFDD